MRVFWDEAQRAHDPVFFMLRGVIGTNYEVAARADALLAACRGMALEIVQPPAPLMSAILDVHTSDLIAFLRDAHTLWSAVPGVGPELVPNHHITPEMAANGGRRPDHILGQLGYYTGDTSMPIGPGSWDAALASAGCAIAAAGEAAAGRHAYALCRPPGHHAYAGRASGHCMLNNAAIAAEALRRRGAARVGILDLDCHHGNGTQGIFWERDDVVTVSVHGDPNNCYPWFVGHPGERGMGAGAGCNLNLPLQRGADDAAWVGATQAGLRRLEDCDALVIALGQDASVHEPLGFLAVTEEGFARAGAVVGAVGKPCAIVQEGGYDVERIGTLLVRFLMGLGE